MQDQPHQHQHLATDHRSAAEGDCASTSSTSEKQKELIPDSGETVGPSVTTNQSEMKTSLEQSSTTCSAMEEPSSSSDRFSVVDVDQRRTSDGGGGGCVNESVEKMDVIPSENNSFSGDFIVSKDDPLCEDIISCISALDEMLAEFDDTSLPYQGDVVESCSSSPAVTTGEIPVTNASVPTQSGVSHQKQKLVFGATPPKHAPVTTTNLAAVTNDNGTSVILEESEDREGGRLSTNLNGNKLVDQNQNLEWNSETTEDNNEVVRSNNNGPVIHTSHLIQIPVVEPVAKPHKGSSSNSNTFNSKSTSEMNGNSISEEKTSSSGARSHQQKKKVKGGSGGGGGNGVPPPVQPSPAPCAGGTYSKGTSYEILIPKIATSGSFSRDSSVSSGKGTVTTSSHSSRASIMVPVIESQDRPVAPAPSGKARSQLNLGIFQRDHLPHATHVPVLGESSNGGTGVSAEDNIGGNCKSKGKAAGNNGSVSSTYITVSEGKSSLGQSSSSSVSSAVMMMMKSSQNEEEQWNFPSEKNLPRSLRKTRKTCFLDEGEGSEAKSGRPRSDRAESPYCDSNGGMSSSCSISEHHDSISEVLVRNGGGGNSHKSPRVMARRGVIPSKCEIINKGDGNFCLEGSTGRIWNGQQQPQPHTTIVSTSTSSSSASAANNFKDGGRSDRRKIYEDVVVLTQTSAAADHGGRGARIQCGLGSSSSPSSTFTTSSGVSVSVNSKSNNSFGFDAGELPPSSSRTRQSKQPAPPKPRVRQQFPAPGLELPSPKSDVVCEQNQFVPVVNGGKGEIASSIPVTMSSHHSPDSEIGTEEDGRGEHFRNQIKVCHQQALNKFPDGEFVEKSSDIGGEEGVKGLRGNGAKGHRSHSISDRFEASPSGEVSGSLPNQSQMMRMMMMMKSTGKNSSVGSASSSSRSSSSSGSVSVKSSSSSSENNCGDVFHENIVQDYPANIFNVATATSGLGGGDSARGSLRRGSGGVVVETKEKVAENNVSVAGNSPVVVLRQKSSGRGNLQQASAKRNSSNGNNASINGNNSTLEIDDGYLSMINRNEAPLLWPEEFIENETFSRDELHRLSVHLNDDDTDEGSSNSNSPPQTTKKSEEEVANKSSLSTCQQHQSSVSISSGSSGNNTGSGGGGGAAPNHPKSRLRRGERAAAHAGRSSTEKTDYFSDDSLEMEGDEELILVHSSRSERMVKGIPPTPANVVVRASTSFVIPFHEKGEESQSRRVVSSDGKIPHPHPIRKSNSQVSRIPKMVSPAASNKRSHSQSNKTASSSPPSSSSNGQHHQSGSTSPTSGLLRKPCSFFIPFSGAAGAADSQTPNLSGDGHKTGRSSIGDNYLVNPGIPSQIVSSSRSTSLPSSRRNSNSSPSEQQQQQQTTTPGIAWSISSSSSPQDDPNPLPHPRQSTTKTKASSDTDSNCSSKRRVDSHPRSFHSSNNQSPQENVMITRGEEKLEEYNDEASSPPTLANRSQEIKTNSVATTTISNSTSSNSTTKQPACETSSGNNSSLSTGGSLSKRGKFEKQQTFIVAPCRDSTSSSAGQRLIETVDTTSTTTGGDDDSSSPSHQHRLTEGSERGAERDSRANETKTPDKELNEMTSNITNDEPKVEHHALHQDTETKKKDSGRHNVPSAVIKQPLQLQQVPHEMSSHHRRQAKKIESELDSSCVSSNSFPSEQQDEEQQDDRPRLSQSDDSTSTPAAQLGVVNLEKPQSGLSSTPEESVKENGEMDCSSGHGEIVDNEKSVGEGQESVAEELETVVKMFLKATEGLLDPERDDDDDVKTGSDNCAKLLSKDDQSNKLECSSVLSPLTDYPEDGRIFNCEQSQDGHIELMAADSSSSLSEKLAMKEPLMTSTPIVPRSSNSPSLKREAEMKIRAESSGLVVGERKETDSENRLSFVLSAAEEDDDEPVIEDLEEQPPTFIPDPPPPANTVIVDPIVPIRIVAPPHTNIDTSAIHSNHHLNLDGKAPFDLLSQRITRKCPSPVENMSVSQFLHNKKNIWAMYDRPYDEDVLPPSFPRGFASRSQENLIDAMTHERLTKSFSARGQSSTLPLNCRPPPVQRRTSTFRNMFNKFRKHKTTDTVIPEGPEIRDEEAQSITSRETGPSEGKKRGFFSRLFRRSRKH